MERHLEPLLEALVLNYSAAIASCIWTSLALFAAGIGLWRFRFFGCSSRSAPPPSATVSPAILPSPPKSAPISSVMVVSDSGEHSVSGSSTKGRFSTYFTVKEESDGGEKGDEYERVSCDDIGDGKWLGLLDWGWRGDLGWYRCQDWKAINGSVVRLWDGGRRGSVLVP